LVQYEFKSMLKIKIGSIVVKSNEIINIVLRMLLHYGYFQIKRNQWTCNLRLVFHVLTLKKC
jgi:hypothetical protein